jgi:hypothetical protein
LRATLNLVANDLRRARSVDDPLTNALRQSRSDVRDTGRHCAIYLPVRRCGALARHSLSTTATSCCRTLPNRPDNCTPGGGAARDHRIRQVEITECASSANHGPRHPSTDETVVRQLTVTLTGRLVDNDPDRPSPRAR